MCRKVNTVVAAVILILSTFNINTAKADTVDDLRDLAGYHRVNSAETRAEIKGFISVYKQAETAQELASMINTIEKTEKANKDKKLLELSNKKAKEEQNLLNLVSNDMEVYDILSSVNKLESIVSEVKQVDSKPISIEVGEVSTEEYEGKYDYMQSLISSMGNDYEIGEIGRDMDYVTEGIFKLKDAFGVYLDKDTNTKRVNNKGVRLYALTYDKTPVKAQWNGVVKSVKGGKIVIKHGPSLETTYSKLKDIQVSVGDKVSQYDLLGDIDGDSLYFAVKLDTLYIDPMMLYGAKGVDLYYEWVNANPARIIELNDMSNFKNKADVAEVEEEVEETTKNADGSINATLPDDYVSPNPGVLE